MYLKLVLVVLSVLNSDKVFCHYDEDAVTTRSYDLQVPGSDPIRIIEAEPLWGRGNQEISRSTSERPWSDLEHRAVRPRLKTTTYQTKTNLNNPNSDNEENETDDTTPDSSEELTKFLRGYADHLKRTTKSSTESNDNNEDDFDSSEKFDKVELITKPSEEPTNRLANLLLGDKNGDSLVLDDKSKSWNLLNLKRHKHPFNDKTGWVSLEVVPWSVSKVAKWHSSIIKPNSDAKPWENKFSAQSTNQWENRYSTNNPSPSKPWDNKFSDYNSNPTKPWENKYPDQNPNPIKPWDNKFSDYNPSSSISKPIWNQPNKPFINYRPGSSNNNYQPKPFDYGSVDHKPNPRPVFTLPSASFGQKVYLQQDYTDEIPKSPYKNPQNFYDGHHDQDYDSNRDQPSHMGIITDGLPPNFPKPHHDHNRRKGSEGGDDHPVLHPFVGEGEWVLLTTTKGYKAPTARQRSLDIELDPELDKESISTHKSVRLTVLPPTKESKVNMTTSHGGLLQVESTFQTVDEAQKMAVKKEKMKLKRRPGRRRPLNKPLKQQNMVEPVQPLNTNIGVSPTVNTRKPAHNPSSVLAAVGAGMIPATMAMLVPMAMGRRRRRDLIFQSRSPDVIGLKLQLPQAF